MELSTGPPVVGQRSSGKRGRGSRSEDSGRHRGRRLALARARRLRRHGGDGGRQAAQDRVDEHRGPRHPHLRPPPRHAVAEDCRAPHRADARRRAQPVAPAAADPLAREHRGGQRRPRPAADRRRRPHTGGGRDEAPPRPPGAAAAAAAAAGPSAAAPAPGSPAAAAAAAAPGTPSTRRRPTRSACVAPTTAERCGSRRRTSSSRRGCAASASSGAKSHPLSPAARIPRFATGGSACKRSARSGGRIRRPASPRSRERARHRRPASRCLHAGAPHRRGRSGTGRPPRLRPRAVLFDGRQRVGRGRRGGPADDGRGVARRRRLRGPQDGRVGSQHADGDDRARDRAYGGAPRPRPARPRPARPTRPLTLPSALPRSDRRPRLATDPSPSSPNSTSSRAHSRSEIGSPAPSAPTPRYPRVQYGCLGWCARPPTPRCPPPGMQTVGTASGLEAAGARRSVRRAAARRRRRRGRAGGRRAHVPPAAVAHAHRARDHDALRRVGRRGAGDRGAPVALKCYIQYA